MKQAAISSVTINMHLWQLDVCAMSLLALAARRGFVRNELRVVHAHLDPNIERWLFWKSASLLLLTTVYSILASFG